MRAGHREDVLLQHLRGEGGEVRVKVRVRVRIRVRVRVTARAL